MLDLRASCWTRGSLVGYEQGHCTQASFVQQLGLREHACSVIFNESRKGLITIRERKKDNILVNRQMKLFDVYVSMLQGTAQGSPISPLLFIAFVNPLIERLRACVCVRLTDDRSIRGLSFAHDICLMAESMEDMRRMLAICEGWAQEFGMAFNAGKSEMMQLAGRISQQRPEVVFAGGMLKWVTECR